MTYKKLKAKGRTRTRGGAVNELPINPGPAIPPQPNPIPPQPNPIPQQPNPIKPMNPMNPMKPMNPIKPMNPSKSHNLKINVCYQTFASIVFAFICIFIQAIVFKKSEVPYLNIILLIFVWPMFIEMLCRGLELNIIAWLLSIVPVIIIIIYDTVTHINDTNDKKKKDKERDYENKERLNEQYELMDILNYY